MYAVSLRIPARSTVHAVLDRHGLVSRAYDGLPEVEYPFHDRDALVTACGRICMYKKKINISTVLAGQRLGIS